MPEGISGRSNVERRTARGILVAAISSGLLIATLGGAGAVGPVIHTLDFHDDFEDGILSAWKFPFPEDWKIVAEGTNHYLHMLRSRPPGVPRRPRQFGLVIGPKVGSFTFQTRLRRERRSLIIVFNYVDTLHFYYAHLSQDTGHKVPVHNGIFIVNGGARRRIAGRDAPAALPDTDWHTARVVRDAETGQIGVYMDGSTQPLFSVSDRTFTCGRMGIGSFDETGDFDDIELHSRDANCSAGRQNPPARAQ
jgi:hypothetical protein